jgi:hypothetical protein
MTEFGKKQYASYAYFNFDEEDRLKSIFEANKNPHRLLIYRGFSNTWQE